MDRGRVDDRGVRGTGEFANRYDVAPIGDGEVATVFSSDNPALGRLQGRFALIEDTILSVAQAPEAGLLTVEVLRQVNEDEYETRPSPATSNPSPSPSNASPGGLGPCAASPGQFRSPPRNPFR